MAIALVSSVSAALGANGGTTGAFNTTGANFIVISVSHYFLGTAAVVSDSKGNTYTALTNYPDTTSVHRIFYVLSPVVGSGHTITVTGTGSYIATSAYAFSGILAYDGQQNGSITFNTPHPCGNVTPSTNGSLIFTGLAGNLAATDTIPTGFTGGLNTPFSGGNNMQNSAAYLIQTTAATINPTWTSSPGHSSAVASVAVFTPSVAAASTETTQFLIVMP